MLSATFSANFTGFRATFLRACVSSRAFCALRSSFAMLRKNGRCGARCGSEKTESAPCQSPRSPAYGDVIQYSDNGPDVPHSKTLPVTEWVYASQGVQSTRASEIGRASCRESV